MQHGAKFITFEGGEGVGKSTQIQATSKYLQQHGIQPIVTREPGGTPLAEEIRGLLVQGQANKMDTLTEYLLLSAARRDHVEKVIKPALQSGHWVLCDRFYDSSRVYQGTLSMMAPNQNQQHHNDYCDRLDPVFMDLVYKQVVGLDFEPDITFIFDLDPQEGLRRTTLRERPKAHTCQDQNQQSEFQEEGRFESKGLAFHHNIRLGFVELAQKNPHRCTLVDASQSPEAVFDCIQSKLNKWLPHD